MGLLLVLLTVLDVRHNNPVENVGERKTVWRWRSHQYNCPLKQIIEVLRTLLVRTTGQAREYRYITEDGLKEKAKEEKHVFPFIL